MSHNSSPRTSNSRYLSGGGAPPILTPQNRHHQQIHQHRKQSSSSGSSPVGSNRSVVFEDQDPFLQTQLKGQVSAVQRGYAAADRAPPGSAPVHHRPSISSSGKGRPLNNQSTLIFTFFLNKYVCKYSFSCLIIMLNVFFLWWKSYLHDTCLIIFDLGKNDYLPMYTNKCVKKYFPIYYLHDNLDLYLRL